jgi:hypothetical protein
MHPSIHRPSPSDQDAGSQTAAKELARKDTVPIPDLVFAQDHLPSPGRICGGAARSSLLLACVVVPCVEAVGCWPTCMLWMVCGDTNNGRIGVGVGRIHANSVDSFSILYSRWITGGRGLLFNNTVVVVGVSVIKPSQPAM